MSGDADTGIRIVIADDHAVVREGIRRVLGQAPDLRVVGEAASGAEAIELVGSLDPDVLILDVTMPGGTGLDVTRTLRDDGRTLGILILSMHERPQYVLEAVRAGAHGYVLKDTPPQQLREAVRAVAAGREYFPTSVAGTLGQALESEAEQAEMRDRLGQLTPREMDVLLGIAAGQTNREIAEAFGISPRTVETHRESLMNKLEVRTVAGLTRLVIEAGLDGSGDAPPRP
ncbi:MAG: response regulator transcription factor [Gemmatimonadetes bacterium]|nr:response regulator transcription factor [Gemmatimonadota bacterium]